MLAMEISPAAHQSRCNHSAGRWWNCHISPVHKQVCCPQSSYSASSACSSLERSPVLLPGTVKCEASWPVTRVNLQVRWPHNGTREAGLGLTLPHHCNLCRLHTEGETMLVLWEIPTSWDGKLQGLAFLAASCGTSHATWLFCSGKDPWRGSPAVKQSCDPAFWCETELWPSFLVWNRVVAQPPGMKQLWPGPSGVEHSCHPTVQRQNRALRWLSQKAQSVTWASWGRTELWLGFPQVKRAVASLSWSSNSCAITFQSETGV